MRAQHGSVDQTMEFDHMLAEKFLLFLESIIRSQTYTDGSPRVVSTSPHVQVKLPQQSGKS
jgi:hypothetical protein